MSDLQVKSLTFLPRIELGYLALYFLHNLDFALEELRQAAHSIVTRLRCLSTMERFLRLSDLAKEALRDLLLRARNDEIEELFVRDDRLVVVRHQVD